jgi:hypothetical protein
MILLVWRYCNVFFEAEYDLIFERRMYFSVFKYRLFFLSLPVIQLWKSRRLATRAPSNAIQRSQFITSLGCHLFIRWAHPLPIFSHSQEKWRTQNVVYLPCVEQNNSQVTTVYFPLTLSFSRTTRWDIPVQDRYQKCHVYIFTRFLLIICERRRNFHPILNIYSFF